MGTSPRLQGFFCPSDKYKHYLQHLIVLQSQQPCHVALNIHITGEET